MSGNVLPLDVTPRYRVRYLGVVDALVMVRIDAQRCELVVTLPNGQWFKVSPEDALALKEALTVATDDYYPRTCEFVEFEAGRSAGEGRWEPWNGPHRE